MGDPSNRPEGTLTTPELVEAIEREFGLRLSREAIRSYMRRPPEAFPLPCAYTGKNGQPHLFNWVDFLEWFDAETQRQERLVENVVSANPADPATGPGSDAHASHIDSLDWHSARTISAREQAKRDILLTAQAEGRFGDLDTMARTAEDRARMAVQQLLAIPSRIAPRLTNIADELVIDRLLDAEIRAVCAEIERTARGGLIDDDAAAPDAATPAPATGTPA